jgi:hypothetical protein
VSERLRPEHVRAVRLGHGANCSSVGSVIDTLFLGAVAGGAIFAAVCAAVEEEKIESQSAPEKGRDDAAEEREE